VNVVPGLERFSTAVSAVFIAVCWYKGDEVLGKLA
jgi:hypothetical protein